MKAELVFQNGDGVAAWPPVITVEEMPFPGDNLVLGSSAVAEQLRVVRRIFVANPAADAPAALLVVRRELS